VVSVKGINGAIQRPFLLEGCEEVVWSYFGAIAGVLPQYLIAQRVKIGARLSDSSTRENEASSSSFMGKRKSLLDKGWKEVMWSHFSGLRAFCDCSLDHLLHRSVKTRHRVGIPEWNRTGNEIY
jgi:hypothetical protein